LTDLTVVATASRPETQDWVRKCGAHYAIDHRQSLASQVEALGLVVPGFVFSTTHSAAHWADIVDLNT
jgi:NADPH:quinone reductase